MDDAGGTGGSTVVPASGLRHEGEVGTSEPPVDFGGGREESHPRVGAHPRCRRFGVARNSIRRLDLAGRDPHLAGNRSGELLSRGRRRRWLGRIAPGGVGATPAVVALALLEADRRWILRATMRTSSVSWSSANREATTTVATGRHQATTQTRRRPAIEGHRRWPAPPAHLGRTPTGIARTDPRPRILTKAIGDAHASRCRAATYSAITHSARCVPATVGRRGFLPVGGGADQSPLSYRSRRRRSS